MCQNRKEIDQKKLIEILRKVSSSEAIGRAREVFILIGTEERLKSRKRVPDDEET